MRDTLFLSASTDVWKATNSVIPYLVSFIDSDRKAITVILSNHTLNVRRVSHKIVKLTCVETGFWEIFPIEQLGVKIIRHWNFDRSFVKFAHCNKPNKVK